MVKMELTDNIMKKLYYPLFNGIFLISESNYDKIVAKWYEPHRFYHGINHLKSLLVKIESKFEDSKKKDCLIIASFLHDVVYDPLGKNNEEESLKYWDSLNKRYSRMASEFNPNALISDYIMSTKSLKDPGKELKDNTFWLIDNSVLIDGSKSRNFLHQYEQDIRKEYPEISDKVYREKRIEFLENWLNDNQHLLSTFKKRNIEGLIYHLNP